MDTGLGRAPRRRVLFALTLCGLWGCEPKLTAVDRLEAAEEATVTVAGSIEVGTPPSDLSETLEMVFNFYAPPGTELQEQRTLLWTPAYRLRFAHDRACAWSFDVTIWDGRRSERKPVSENPPSPCAGFIVGPNFWFP